MNIGGINAALDAYKPAFSNAWGASWGSTDSSAASSGVGAAFGTAEVGGKTEKLRADGRTVDGKDPDARPGFESSPEKCETCRERKYKDGSDEEVSFKSPTHISPNAAGAAVRAHEGEHVANAYKKAAMEGGRVIHCGVAIHTATCPECGRTYVSGGVTNTAIATPKEDPNKKKENPYLKQAAGILGDIGVGARANFAV